MVHRPVPVRPEPETVVYVSGREGAVIFVGMDTPELPWAEVIAAKNAAEMESNAYICPGEKNRERARESVAYIYGQLMTLKGPRTSLT